MLKFHLHWTSIISLGCFCVVFLPRCGGIHISVRGTVVNSFTCPPPKLSRIQAAISHVKTGIKDQSAYIVTSIMCLFYHQLAISVSIIVLMATRPMPAIPPRSYGRYLRCLCGLPLKSIRISKTLMKSPFHISVSFYYECVTASPGHVISGMSCLSL